MADRVLLPGSARGRALVLDEPLSMWGGLEAATGRIIDARHPQAGSTVTGSVLVMPAGRGSSSAASVLAEALRLGTGPAALVLAVPDGILLIGALVAEQLYGVTCPVVVPSPAAYSAIETGDDVEVRADGLVQH